MVDKTIGLGGDFSINPAIRIDSVSINVSNIDRSLDFYETVLGFKKLTTPSSESIILSANGHQSPLVELLPVKNAAAAGHGPQSFKKTVRRAGLYHFAILLPERKYLAEILQSLSERRGEIRFDGLADHLVSESIYIRDPDDIGIEIYCDRPDSQWKWDGSQVRMATVRLGTEDLLRESTGLGWKGMPAKTVIGHVHLHVRNLVNAMRFYRDTFGLNHTASYPGAYFFAAGRYHHHIATNTWLGSNIQPASSEDIGLNHFSVELLDNEQYEKTAQRLGEYRIETPGHVQSNGSRYSFFRDNDGITMMLYTR
jgi:catechol 2,3-dioxygenase